MNTGTDTPKRENPIKTWSTIPFFLTAAIIPQIIPTTHATIAAAIANFTVLGKDTIDFSFVDADYKVLTYIDSMGCASCKLQLPRWKEWVHEVDSLTDGKVPFLFYLLHQQGCGNGL